MEKVETSFELDRIDMQFIQNPERKIDYLKKKALCMIGAEVGKIVPFEKIWVNAHTDRYSLIVGVTDVKKNNLVKKEIRRLLKQNVKDTDVLVKIEILLNSL